MRNQETQLLTKKIGISNENIYIGKDIKLLSYDYLKQYNLLPNDALILATAKINNMDILASYDKKDFQNPCTKEGIKLITSISELK